MEPFAGDEDWTALTVPPLMDLYGNDVEHAMADYRYDGRRGIYERHSPETTLGPLGAPVF
jgi:hypothetical protein